MPDDRIPAPRIRSPDQMTTGETKCQRAGLDSHYRLDSRSVQEYRQMCMKSNRLGTQLIQSKKNSQYTPGEKCIKNWSKNRPSQSLVSKQNKKNPKLGMLYPKRTTTRLISNLGAEI